MTASASTIPHVRAPRFYFVMALVFAFLAFTGFGVTYIAPVSVGEFRGPPIIHLHGLLFFAWTILFIVQTRLAQSSVQTHRAVGFAGISLATAIVFTTAAVLVRILGLAAENGAIESARALVVVPVFGIVTFAVCFALAVAHVRRPESHKRFMILAMAAIMQPACARVLFALFAPPGATLLDLTQPIPDFSSALNLIIVPAVLADLAIVAAAVYDWRTRGRPHRIYVIGGLCIFGAQLLRPWMAQTSAWHAAMDALRVLGQ